MSITYKTLPQVKTKEPAPAEEAVVMVSLDGRHAGFIYRVPGGYAYQPKGGREHRGSVLDSIAAVKETLEGD